MNSTKIKRAIEAHGFCFTDVTTPDGDRVRVTARGPKTPADPVNDGNRPTVVEAKQNGRVLDRVEKSTQGSGAAAYAKMVDRYSEGA